MKMKVATGGGGEIHLGTHLLLPAIVIPTPAPQHHSDVAHVLADDS